MNLYNEDYKYKTNIFSVIIEIEPHELNDKLNRTLINKIKRLYECKCNPHYGYIKKNSIKIIKKSIGILRPNSFTGSFLYNVEIEVQSIKPVEGDTFICNVAQKNDSGLMATVSNLPFNIYILKDYIDNKEVHDLIDSIEDKSIIEIKVEIVNIDAKNNRYIIVGLLNRKISLFTKIYSLINSNSDLIITTANIERQTLQEFTDMNYNLFITPLLNKKLKQLKQSIGGLKSHELSKKMNIKGGKLIINTKKIESEDNGKKFWNLIKNIIHDHSLLEESYWFKDVIISRAFYKMLEMINMFNLTMNKNMNILNLAESPGGFVQAILYIRNLQNDYIDKYNIVSIAENERLELWERENNIIKYVKNSANGIKYFGDVSFLQNEDNLGIQTNINLVDGKYGDLLKPQTFEYIMNDLKYNTNKADLITADGAYGYNEGEDEYQNQEILHYGLFIGEIMVALAANAPGGNFILKIFDIFTELTVKLIYILNCCYQSVKIYKPETSRNANSEKYIICMNFIPPENIEDIITKLKFVHSNLYNAMNDMGSFEDIETKLYNVILDFELSSDFIQSIKIYNDMFIKNQIQNISNGIQIGGELIHLLENTNNDIEAFNKYVDNKNAVKIEILRQFIKTNYLPDIQIL